MSLPKFIALLNDLLHDRTGTCHEFLKGKGLVVLSPLFLILELGFGLVGSHDIIWGLVVFIAESIVFSLHLLLNFIHSSGDERLFVGASEQFLVINILLGTRDHFKYVDMLFLV